MQQNLKWWHWLIAAGFVLPLGFFLQTRVFNPPLNAPPTARANGQTDEQVKAEMHAEVEALTRGMAAHAPKQ
jgi:hypothetical protein